MEKVSCNATTIRFIKDAVETADLVGLESMMFRPGLVSGAAGKTGLAVIMLHNHTEELSLDVLGVMNAKDLKVRLALIEAKEGAIEADTIKDKIDDDPTQRVIATKLLMKNGRMKMTYAAGSPKALRAPRRITFNEQHSLPLDPAGVSASVSLATRALLCDADTTITLSAARGELTATVIDKNNDTYEDVIASVGDSAAFSHRYVLNYFLPMMRAQAENIPVVISKEGLLRFSINGFTVYQLPKV